MPESRWVVVFVNSLEMLEQRRSGTLANVDDVPGSRQSENETVAVVFVGVAAIVSSGMITVNGERHDWTCSTMCRLVFDFLPFLTSFFSLTFKRMLDGIVNDRFDFTSADDESRWPWHWNNDEQSTVGVPPVSFFDLKPVEMLTDEDEDDDGDGDGDNDDETADVAGVTCKAMFLYADVFVMPPFDARRSALRCVSMFVTDVGIEWDRRRYVSQPKSFKHMAPSGDCAIKLNE
jgi:hypothetical protein